MKSKKSLYDSISKNKKLKSFLIKLSIVLIVATFSLFFLKQLFAFTVTLLLVVLASVSKIYKKFIGFSIGFELVTFASIIFFFSYGFGLGLMLSTLMLALSTLISGRFSHLFIAQWIIYLIIGALSIFLKSLGIQFAGKILVLVYNILLHSFSQFVLHYPIHSTITNFVINLATNFLFMDYFAMFFVNALESIN
jgi:hypothetical protein